MYSFGTFYNASNASNLNIPFQNQQNCTFKFQNCLPYFLTKAIVSVNIIQEYLGLGILERRIGTSSLLCCLNVSDIHLGLLRKFLCQIPII